MAAGTRQGKLLSDDGVRDDARVINGRCLLRVGDGYRVVLVAGIPVAHFADGDRMAEAHAMVSLVAQGHASQVEVARAFGCSTRTVRRDERRFEEGGLPALGRGRGYPSGRPRVPAQPARRYPVTRQPREPRQPRRIRPRSAAKHSVMLIAPTITTASNAAPMADASQPTVTNDRNPSSK